MATGLFARGRDARFLAYFNNGKWPINAKNWRIQEQATLAVDHVCGEQRARLQKVTDYYQVTIDCFDDGGSRIIQNLLQNQANEDAVLPDLPLAGGTILTFRGIGGTKLSLTFKNCSMGPMDMNVPARDDAVMHALSFRCQFVSITPSA